MSLRWTEIVPGISYMAKHDNYIAKIRQITNPNNESLWVWEIEGAGHAIRNLSYYNLSSFYDYGDGDDFADCAGVCEAVIKTISDLSQKSKE